MTRHNENCPIVQIVRYNTGIWMLRVELDNLGAYSEKFAYNILQFIRPWRQDRASKPTRCPALRLLRASRNAYSPRLNARIKEIWLFSTAQPEQKITLGVYKKFYDFNSKKFSLLSQRVILHLTEIISYEIYFPRIIFVIVIGKWSVG